MQSEIFQAFICYNFDDYGLQFMKTFLQYSNFLFVSNFELLHDVLTFRVSPVFAVYHHCITTILSFTTIYVYPTKIILVLRTSEM